jgi:hypothetical protein
VYGLGIPGLGPQGIGAGVLGKEVPDKKHARFFTYAAALIFGGMIGLDSFLVGESKLGLFRLIATITMILVPISTLILAYKSYQFFFDTKTVVGEYSNYFGGPGLSGLEAMYSGFIGALLAPFAPVFTAYNTTMGVIDKGLNAVTTVTDVIKEGMGMPTPVGSMYSSVTVPGLMEAKELREVAGGIVNTEGVMLLIKVLFEAGGVLSEQLLGVL